MTEKEELDLISEAIIGAAIDVHKALGPGLLESAYASCIAYELASRSWHLDLERPLPLVYRGLQLDCGYRLDMVVADRIIVEIKSIEHLLPIHRAQLLSYLKLSGCKLGLLINFNVVLLKNGITRLVNGLDEGGPTTPLQPRQPS